MERNEQELIDELFGNLAQLEREAGPRDAEAERHIDQRVERQPASVYFMAQSLILQERALAAAQERIEELEREAEARAGAGGRGSFLGGLFSGGGAGDGASGARTSVPSTGSVPSAGNRFSYPGQGAAADRDAGSYRSVERNPEPEAARGSGGGSFLGGVMQTAAGVAGGVVLGNMITGMLGGQGHEAQAAQQPESAPGGSNSANTTPEAAHDKPAQDTAGPEADTGLQETGGFDDFGSDFDFDI